MIKNDLTARQKEQLLGHIMAAVQDIQVTDIAILLPMLMNSAPIQQTVLNTVVSFIGNEMRLQVVD